MVEKQEYDRLNSKQMERIFLKNDEMTNLKLKSMEDLLLKDVLERILIFFEEFSDDVE